LNVKPRHILICVLSEQEIAKVHAMTNVKEMWETLTLSYERFKEFKINKITLFRRQYEMFNMEDNESVPSVIAKLKTILNNMGLLECMTLN